MAYPPLVRQDGFQLPSPAHTSSPKSSPDDDRDDQLFMPQSIPFLKFPTHPSHQQHQIDFTEELATLIDTPHVSSQDRSTFDIQHHQHQHDIYHNNYPHFNTALPSVNPSVRYDTHHESSTAFQYPHSPSPHRSRSRSRAPSVGPTRSAHRERRANSISSHVSSTSPPPRPHPHAIVIPGRGNPMGGFFVPNGTSAPPDYNLPTPDSLSHSLGLQHTHPHSHSHSQFPYPAPSSPYYTYPQQINQPGTPNMGISPTNVETLSGMSISSITAQHLASSLPTRHVNNISKQPTPLPSASPSKQLDPECNLSEKRRRRRESHNAVERRRRDNINERIGELAGLIPGVLFECDGPLVAPGSTPLPGSTSSAQSLAEDLFSLGILGDNGMHVLPTEEGLPDLPEEGSLMKKDPSEEGEVLTPLSPMSGGVNGATPTGMTVHGSSNEQSTIKANKGMILRKSVEYIRYLQQLVSVQASRGRDLEERNQVLERELALLRGDVPSSSSSSSAPSSSPSVTSSTVLSMLSSRTSGSSKPPSVAESNGVGRCGEDLEMEDGSGMSSGERSRERAEVVVNESRGRQLGRVRDRTHIHGLAGQGMEI